MNQFLDLFSTLFDSFEYSMKGDQVVMLIEGEKFTFIPSQIVKPIESVPFLDLAISNEVFEELSNRVGFYKYKNQSKDQDFNFEVKKNCVSITDPENKVWNFNRP